MEIKKCEYCRKILSEKQARRKTLCCSHTCANSLRYIDVPKVLVCQACGETYNRRSWGKEGLKYCSVKCSNSVNAKKPWTEQRRKRLAEAQRLVRVEGEFVCDRCGRMFTSNTSCRAHKARCGHIREMMRCVKCGREFIGLCGLKAHQRDCYGTQEWKNARDKKFSDVAIRRCQLGIATKSTGTGIEMLFESGLKRLGIKFEKQFVPDGIRHCFDFYIPEYKLLVEVDGDYWHGNPDRFRELSVWQKRQWHVDHSYTKMAREQGFKVIRFWGKDVERYWEECGTEAIEYGKGSENRGGRARASF